MISPCRNPLVGSDTFDASKPLNGPPRVFSPPTPCAFRALPQSPGGSWFMVPPLFEIAAETFVRLVNLFIEEDANTSRRQQLLMRNDRGNIAANARD